MPSLPPTPASPASHAASPPPSPDPATGAEQPAPARRRWHRSLFVQIAAGIVLGITLGSLAPSIGADLRPVSDGFVKLIKMLISPIVFCVVVTGIAHVGDLRSVGRIGLKALVYFEAVTTLALLIGLAVGNIVRPGAGFHVDAATIARGGDAIAEKTDGGHLPHTVEFLLDIIPTSALSGFVENQMLQVLFLAVFFGLALTKFRASNPLANTLLTGIQMLSGILFVMVGWIMRLAPLATFAAMAYIIGQYGLGSLASFARLIAACYGAGILLVLVLAAIARAYLGINLFRFIAYAREEFGLALGTASTEVVLPRIIGKLERAGASDTSAGLVVPTGYSFNLDGATLYLSICTLFLAQAVGVDLSLGEQVTALLVLMLTSKGMAGVPGSSFLALSATIGAIGHHAIPVGAVALLLGVDRIMDSMRVSINLLGNCVATLVVAKWEGQLDEERLHRVVGA